MNRPFVRGTLTVLLALTLSHASAQEGSDPATASAPAPAIVALGDSVTAGFGLGPRDKFPALLQRRLAEEGYPHKIVNAGRNGDSTTGALRRLDRVLVPDTRILLVALGGNDRRLGASADTIYKKPVPDHRAGAGARHQGSPVRHEHRDRRHVDQAGGEISRGLVPSMMEDVRADPGLRLPNNHPNRIGARLIAEMIWTHLQPMLGE